MSYEEFMIAKTLLSIPTKNFCQALSKFDEDGRLFNIFDLRVKLGVCDPHLRKNGAVVVASCEKEQNHSFTMTLSEHNLGTPIFS